MSWTHEPLADAPVEIIDGDRGKNYPSQNELLEEGHCLFLSATNVTKDGFVFEKCQFVTEQKNNALRKGQVRRNDIVLTTRGTLGNVAYYSGTVPFEHVRINSGMVTIQSDNEKLLPRYLYYFLKSELFQAQVRSLQSGAAQPQLPIRDIKKIKISYPDPIAQDRIADTVGTYDDLIENNRRRIALLEEAARLLYREWFVHFRFPGAEHVKIVDGVPEGWKLGAVGALAKVNSGYAFKSKDWLDVGNPVIKIKNIVGDGTINTIDCQYVDDSIAETAAKFQISADDLLIAMTGATVGKVGIMPKTDTTFYLNQRVGLFNAIVENKIIPFLFSFFNTEYAQLCISSVAGGAAQPNISGKQIEEIELLIPEKNILNWFLESTSAFFEQRQTLFEKNIKLIEARDLLLPRLMDGRLEI